MQVVSIRIVKIMTVRYQQSALLNVSLRYGHIQTAEYKHTDDTD